MTLLGGLTPAEFLREHWQKRPLLVRQAVPGFRGLVSRAELAALAEVAVARTVATTTRKGEPAYRVDEGPFEGLDLSRAPQKDFTLLVQGIEQHVPAAWDLLRRFDFIPRARVDDVMVSWAQPGGGVGPHFDLYDVFLLQGEGRRRWRVTKPLKQHELGVVDSGGVRVLKRFEAAEEHVLEPGDMLYVPPKVGHHGTAIDACFTYSIGFLAPSHEQLVHNFLGFLGEEAGSPKGIYADPDLTPQEHPAELGDDAVARVEQVLAQLAWDRERVATFLGRLLTGPKPSAVIVPPDEPLDARAFAELLEGRGALRLTGASRVLFRRTKSGARVFVNGEALDVTGAAADVARALADERALPLPVAPAVRADRGVQALLHELYVRGALHVEREATPRHEASAAGRRPGPRAPHAPRGRR